VHADGRGIQNRIEVFCFQGTTRDNFGTYRARQLASRYAAPRTHANGGPGTRQRKDRGTSRATSS